MANVDTFKLSSDFNQGLKEIEAKATFNNARIANSNLIEYSISPLYQRYIGKTVTIAFNGNFMKLPVDGSTARLSRGHYNSLMKYLRHIDKQINIANNNTKFMGGDVKGDFRQL